MEALQNKILREYVTHLDFVPTMFTAFYHLDPTFSKLECLDTLCSGGGIYPLFSSFPSISLLSVPFLSVDSSSEGPTAELHASFYSGPLSTVLLHCYGPTETIVVTHLHRGTYDKVLTPIGPLCKYRNQVILDSDERLLPLSM
jgi:hypothetical protein